jgi:integrase
MGTIRFELRKDKIDKDGKSPIRIIYQIKSDRKYYSTGEKVPESNWNEKDQEAVYFKIDEHGKKVKGELMDLDVKKINNALKDLKRDIEKIEERFEANGVVYDVEMIISELQGSKLPIVKKDASSKELFAFIDKYINDHELTRVKGSLSVYRSLKGHLQGYEQKTGKAVTFDKIDYSFFQGFQNYLVGLTKKEKDQKTGKEKTVRALNNITIAKQLSTLKTFLNYAKAQGIEVSNKYASFKIKRENDLEVIALTRKEFDALYNMDLSKRPAWDQVRDVFIFSCATGLRYSDLNQLRREHIKEEHIDLTAIKTSHKTKIPLNPYSKAILKKYAKNPKPLPVISNQRSNEHLEKICDWAGLNEPVEIVRKYGAHREEISYKKYQLIRMHCGRKTFASLSLEAGMPAEYVMKIGGWKDYKSFKRYMNLTDESTMKAMSQAWGAKIVQPKLKAV